MGKTAIGWLLAAALLTVIGCGDDSGAAGIRTGTGGSGGGGSGSGGIDSSMCGGAGPSTTALDAEEQSFLALLNEHRVANGASPVAACTSLSRAAQGHSEDMRDQDYFDHTSLDGFNPGERACEACYTSCEVTGWGENIAAGNSGAEGTFDQWVNSPGHNANMLNRGYAVVGIGRATGGGTYGAYWTTVFGGQSDSSCE